MKEFIRQVCLLIAFFIIPGLVSYAQNILEPGVGYITRWYVEKGHTFGITGPEYHQVEITIFNDGTASSVYSIGLHHYGEEDSKAFNLNGTGRWKIISKYDKKVLDIFLKFEDNTNYESFHLYVDSDLKAYVRDLNNIPTQLYNKANVLAEEREKLAEEQAKKEQEEARAREWSDVTQRYDSLMLKNRVFYEIIDLGLSVKWANVNQSYAFAGSIKYMQLDNMGDLKHPRRLYTLDGLDKVEKYEILRDELNFKYEYYIDTKGNVDIRQFYDKHSAYVAGGNRQGYPYSVNDKDRRITIQDALLYSLKENPNPSLSNLKDQEKWAKTYAASGHYPTKAEWQELMDNCTVTGVETNPILNNPIRMAYYKHFGVKEESHIKMLKITSKINGKSLFLPFDSRKGTNYATSQYLSSNPNEVTCVHVDINGLTFIEVNREEEIAHRHVFGEINMASIKAERQAAKDKYPTSPYALEQKKLREELEEKITDGMLTIGAPSITMKGTSRQSSNWIDIEVKAPIISGKITKNSIVLVAFDTGANGEFSNVLSKAVIYEGDGDTPAYIVAKDVIYEKNTKTKELIKQHCLYFVTDNRLAISDKEITNDRTLDMWLSEFCKKELTWVMENGYNNAFNQKTKRRLIITPATYFSLYGANNTVKYESGPSPIPVVGTPKVSNLGKTKGKGTYSNVEIAFDITESDYPFPHPQTQSFNLRITSTSVDKEIKTKYIETIGDTRKYVIKNLTAGIPYTLTGYATDQYGITYKSSATITINTDGTIFTETKGQSSDQ